MYRFALCDDAPADLRYLSELVSRWAGSRGDAAVIETFPSAEAFLFRYAENRACDVLLLDVELGGMDGVTLAKKVRAGNREVQIVFVTGYMEYIAAGYDVEALHYLLKPVTREKLFAVLDRAAGKLRRGGRALLLACADGTVRVPFEDIRFLEVRQNYVTVHAGEEYRVKKPLAELEKELDDGFFRTGRSFIVNLRFVTRITKNSVVLRGSGQVPLSRGLYDRINRAVIEYF